MRLRRGDQGQAVRLRTAVGLLMREDLAFPRLVDLHHRHDPLARLHAVRGLVDLVVDVERGLGVLDHHAALEPLVERGRRALVFVLPGLVLPQDHPDQVVLVLFVILVLQRRIDLVVRLGRQGSQVLDLRRVEVDALKRKDFWHCSLRKRARRALHIGEPPGRRQTFLPRAAVPHRPSTARGSHS